MNAALLCVSLLFLLGGTAALQVVCPAEVQVEEGDTAEFRCQLDESVGLGWSVAFTKDGNKNLVCRYTNGEDNVYDQMTQFKNRTWLSHDHLATGEVLLRISRVQQEDAGRYRLRVKGPNSSVQKFDVELKVAVKTDKKAAGGEQEPTTDPPHTPMDGTSTPPPDVCPPKVQVEEGDTAEFRCQLDESVGLGWSVAFTKDGNKNLVCRYTNGEDNFNDQMPQFKDRTWLSHDHLATGVVLLRISRVQREDAGRYRLRVKGPKSSAQTCDVELKVAVKKGEKAAGGGQEPTTDHTPMDGTSTPPPDGGHKKDSNIAIILISIFGTILILIM